MSETNEPVNRCPKCGRELMALWLEGEWRFYRCDEHGTVVITPQGPAEMDEPDDSKVRR